MPRYAKPLTDPEEIALWDAVVRAEGTEFSTTGSRNAPARTFRYRISTYIDGERRPVKGAELFIERKQKSISRSTILAAWRKAKELGGAVKGPKALGVPGAGSYLYPMFRAFGLIR